MATTMVTKDIENVPTVSHLTLICGVSLASFPGSTQLSVVLGMRLGFFHFQGVLATLSPNMAQVLVIDIALV